MAAFWFPSAVAAVVLSLSTTQGIAQTDPARPIGTAVIRGVVRDSIGAALRGAEVRVLPGGPFVSADREGRFTLRAVPPGAQRLMVRRFGYAPELSDVTIAAGDTITLDFELARAPQELSAVEVRERALVPEEYRFTTRFDNFFSHRATSVGGQFFDRGDLERLGGPTRALNSIAGVKVSESAGNIQSIRFNRCPVSSTPAVLIDGLLANALETIDVASIELIEVYRSVADMPVDARGHGCGAIVIYTR